MFHYIERYDYPLIWLNLLFLLCIAFLPVASSILGHYHRICSRCCFIAACYVLPR